MKAAASPGRILVHRVGGVLAKETPGQRFEPSLLGNGGPRPALRPEGKVKILQDGHCLGCIELSLEFFGQKPSLFERTEDSVSPAVQFGEVLDAVPDCR